MRRTTAIAASVVLAVGLAGAAFAQPGADGAWSATPILGDAVATFDLTPATTDGLPHEACNVDDDPQTSQDVWWIWTATCDGLARISTCGLTNVDTEIVVYGGVGPRPPSDSAVIACNDQYCGNQSQVEFIAQAGQQYLVRLGRYANVSPGAGQIRFECVGEAFCSTSCTPPNYGGGASSNSDTLHAVPWTAPETGVIEGVCVTGYTLPNTGVERLRVRYYRDEGGRPGGAIASYEPSRVYTRPFVWSTINCAEIALGHEPVSVEAGQTVWIEVMNLNPAVTWLWMFVGGAGSYITDGTPQNQTYEQLPSSAGTLAHCIAFRDAPCPGDLNGDDQVNFADLNTVLSAFNGACP